MTWQQGRHPDKNPAKCVVLELPIFLPSVSNLREHWASKARRIKDHRKAAAYKVGAAIRYEPGDAYDIHLVRIARRSLDEADNLPAAFKGIVDGIADAFLMKDNDPRLSFTFGQEKVSASKHLKDYQVGKVRVEISVREGERR